jgi:hypothetical protein
MAYFKISFWYLTGGTQQNYKSIIHITGDLVMILNRCILCTSQTAWLHSPVCFTRGNSSLREREELKEGTDVRDTGNLQEMTANRSFLFTGSSIRDTGSQPFLCKLNTLYKTNDTKATHHLSMQSNNEALHWARQRGHSVCIT